MNDPAKNGNGLLLERLAALASSVDPPTALDPGLEFRLLARLGRRRFPLRIPWDLILLALLLASLAWDLWRIASHVFH